jgi:membrane protein DedA with SNARE-associated domain
VPDLSHVLFVLAESPWALVTLAALLVVDGFFPFVPGETFVVTLATLGVSGHGPAPWAVLVVASAATMVGDGIAFLVGRRIGTERWAWMRRPRLASAFGWAATGLVRRPALFLIAAKFVPFVRVAVTMTAGAGGLRLLRYLPISLVASVLYTGYHVAVALILGSVFAATPLIGAALAIVTVVVVGIAIERAERRRIARAARAEAL